MSNLLSSFLKSPDSELLPNDVSKIINRSTVKASSIAVLPLPIIDTAGVTYIQYRLIEKLADYYGQEMDSSNQVIITSLLTSVAATLISEMSSYLVEQVGVSKIVSENVIKSAISGFSTKAMGEVYALNMQSGKNIEEIGFDEFINYFSSIINSGSLNPAAVTEDLLQAI